MLRYVLFTLIISVSAIYADDKKIDNNNFMLLSGNSNFSLAVEVSNLLGVNINKDNVQKFNDGEINIKISERIRNKDVFILQSTCRTNESSVNDNLMELYLMIRACKRASPKSIIAVLPYFGYARQDRKESSRVPISASDIAMILELAGANHVISVDLHSSQIQGFFHNISVDNLTSAVIFVPYIARRNPEKLVVVAPDAGALGRAKKFQNGLKKYGIEADLAIVFKERHASGEVNTIQIIGNVKDCDVVIVDDICDTGTTLVKAVDEIKNLGAKKIYACITHPVFSKNAMQIIKNSKIHELMVTDTIPLSKEAPSNITQISIAPLIAEAIRKSQNS